MYAHAMEKHPISKLNDELFPMLKQNKSGALFIGLIYTSTINICIQQYGTIMFIQLLPFVTSRYVLTLFQMQYSGLFCTQILFYLVVFYHFF